MQVRDYLKLFVSVQEKKEKKHFILAVVWITGCLSLPPGAYFRGHSFLYQRVSIFKIPVPTGNKNNNNNLGASNLHAENINKLAATLQGAPLMHSRVGTAAEA